ncbi:hypothetical protein T05_485 [Trichinella murrelli]|uniref:Uncharacterized protein n=1 Tax=Trichinella murrelli TaxID=144512 RepID=A0A0V0TM81_9BILA|nr:hypothetical protein T05_485 [Trichinella murrelli]
MSRNRNEISVSAMRIAFSFGTATVKFSLKHDALVKFDPQQEVPMHKNRFSTLRYANNDHHKGALSSVKLMKQRKSENADDTNQITDGTMQNKRRQEEEVDVMSCVLAL